MKYNKKVISLEDLNTFNTSLKQAVQGANPSIEFTRCCFKIKDNSIIYYYTAFDWIDANIDLNKIEKFIVYQLFNEN